MPYLYIYILTYNITCIEKLDFLNIWTLMRLSTPRFLHLRLSRNPNFDKNFELNIKLSFPWLYLPFYMELLVCVFN